MEKKVFNNINEYLDVVCSQIRFKKSHKMIRKELESHIYELIEKDDNEKNAEEQAIKKMGDPIVIGQELDKVYKPSFDFMLLILGGFIVTISLFVWISLSKNNVIDNLYEGIICLIVSIIFCGLLIYFDYRILAKKDGLIFFIGIGINIMSILTSYKCDLILLAILAYIISISSMVNKYKYTYKNIGMMLTSLILILQASFTYTFLLMLTYMILFIINRINKKRTFKMIIKTINSIFTFIIISLILSSAIMYCSKSMTDKFNVFLNPEVDPYGDGWEYIQSKYILDNAKKEYSQNNDIINNYPLGELEQQNIFIYIAGKFGIYILLVILLVIYLIIGKMINNIVQIKDGFGRNMIVCFASLFIIEFILNILKSIQLIPKVSINLPFLSFENINIFTSIIILALTISIYKSKDIVEYYNC